jgi:uroporphyrinogen decarboxylase
VLGRSLRFVEGQGPVLQPLATAADVRALSQAPPIEQTLAPVYEAVRAIASALPEEIALIGFAGAPWTVALYMVEGRGGTDGARARSWAYKDRDSFAALIDVLVDVTSTYLVQQVAAGAEAIQLFDSWAGLLSATEFLRWVVAPTQEIVRRVRQHCPNVPIIGFPRGAGLLYADYAQKTGVDAVGLDASVPVHWARETMQPLCCVQGNLDNVLLKVGGPALDEETDAALDALGEGPYVFNLGHGILPETPPEHVARVAARVRSFRRADVPHA